MNNCTEDTFAFKHNMAQKYNFLRLSQMTRTEKRRSIVWQATTFSQKKHS